MAIPNNNEQHHQPTTATGGNTTTSSILSSEQRSKNEDITMEETHQDESPTAPVTPVATVTDNTPTRAWIISTTPEPAYLGLPSQALVKRAMVRDLPKFKVLNDDTKDPDDAFVSVNQYFKAFERTFRMQNVDLLELNWRDNLANVIGIDYANWYSDTIIEQNMAISYTQAKAMNMDHIESPAKAISMFNKLNLSVRTSLSSHLGISFLHRLKSFRQVEALISGLEVHVSEGPFVASMSKRPKRNHEPKLNGGERSSGNKSNKKCYYCNQPWEKGHRCSEFHEAKKAKQNQGQSTHHKSANNNQVRTIMMDQLKEEWTNFDMKSSKEDEAIDNAIAASEDDNTQQLD
ncbi:uncharacterized protein ATC70_011400 [Mucor velutinosus]|uniref:Uncharacterized protein n=1 Tax=Mucor velutinosus TaxID=708070 RepID=A0AAN7I0L3_9FUNG|nr:hypothetical protein ATC70_011400 [Mucor velutinosus]